MRALALGLLLLASPFATGADLLAAYEAARESDPQLRLADSARLAEGEGVVQARAALLPQLAASASLMRSSSEGELAAGGRFESSSRSRDYGISLQQLVYDHAALARLRAARASASRAEAEYEAARNGLLLRVAERYFEVLTAVETLLSARAEERAVGRQLEQAEQRFAVGLTAITDVHEARARFDAARAAAIAAANALDDAREALAELTGRDFEDLAALAGDLPELRPDPEEMEAWVRLAEEASPTLRARRLAVEAGEEGVAAARGGHYPTLSLGASWQDDRTLRGQMGPFRPSATESDGITLQLRIPIFEGFAVQSRVRQSLHRLDQARDQLEADRRAILRQTRNAYRAVIAGASEVEARRQALVSARSALEATQAGFEVGTRTIVDVLLSQQQLFAAQREYARARHNLLLNHLRLKTSAGVIAREDLEAFNRLLTRRIRLERLEDEPPAP
ncbi:MAG: TolC family outer membrane protein [Xanthomonadales bacterium]|nr:TolC family outer membrane protein [Xanthomonadales bacterium]